MDNYFPKNFQKNSGSQEDYHISFLVVFTQFLVVEDTRTREFCYPACLVHSKQTEKTVANFQSLMHSVLKGGVPIFGHALILGQRHRFCTF